MNAENGKKKSLVSTAASIGCLLMVSACGAAEEPSDSAVAEAGAAVDSVGCANYDAYDHWIGENWPEQAIHSDAVDYMDTNDPAQFTYNGYAHDHSGVCPKTFVTDVTARPLGNTKSTFRATFKSVPAGLTAARCAALRFDYVLYGRKFNGDSTWRRSANPFLSAVPRNGRCDLPYQQFALDWKDGGINSVGKVSGLRFAIEAYELVPTTPQNPEGKVYVPTCLAIDGDDQGDHLNALCPILNPVAR